MRRVPKPPAPVVPSIRPLCVLQKMNPLLFIVAISAFLDGYASTQIPPRMAEDGRYLTINQYEAYLNDKEQELIERLREIDEDCEIQYPFLEVTGEERVFSHDYLPEKEYNDGTCSYAVSFPKPSTWYILKERLNYKDTIFLFETPRESMTLLKIRGEFRLWVTSGGGITYPEMTKNLEKPVVADSGASPLPREDSSLAEIRLIISIVAILLILAGIPFALSWMRKSNALQTGKDYARGHGFEVLSSKALPNSIYNLYLKSRFHRFNVEFEIRRDGTIYWIGPSPEDWLREREDLMRRSEEKRNYNRSVTYAQGVSKKDKLLAIHLALTRLMERNNGNGFVIFSDRKTGKFV